MTLAEARSWMMDNPGKKISGIRPNHSIANGMNYINCP